MSNGIFILLTFPAGSKGVNNRCSVDLYPETGGALFWKGGWREISMGRRFNYLGDTGRNCF